MDKTKKFSLCLGGVALSFAVSADNGQLPSQSTTVHSQWQSTDKKSSENNLTKQEKIQAKQWQSTDKKSSENNLTKQEKIQAKQWQLTENDWLKYKNIMRGPRGVWSPGLDPLTALGVSETDSFERQRYAELWMQLESQRVELEMAFEVERQHAAQRLFQNQLAINNQIWIDDWQKKHSEITQQVAFFVEADCREDCQTLFHEVSASVGDKARLDVYFQSGATAASIGQWAAFMNIAQAQVKQRKITLNFDEGKSQSLEVDMADLPQVRVVDLNTGVYTATYRHDQHTVDDL